MTADKQTHSVSNLVLLERIDVVSKDVCQVVEDIRSLSGEIKTYAQNQIRLEGQMQRNTEKVEENKKEIDENTKILEEVKKNLAPLTVQSRIITWIAGIFGVSIIALIWGIIIGQITLTF